MPKLIDLKGQRFGKLTVVERTENDTQNRPTWKCRCDCGEYTIARSSALRSGQKSSCGCLQREKVANINKGKSKSENLTEKRFEMLVAKRQVGISKNGGALWECICDCGNKITIPATYLKRGISYSCGCKKKLGKNVSDLTGQKFGKLTVMRLGKDLILPSGGRVRRWECECDCGGNSLVIHSRLINHKTNSCGCIIGSSFGKRKNNNYTIDGEYAYISIGNEGEKVICDKDMVDEFSQYYWYIDSHGYVCTRTNKTRLKMHKVVMSDFGGDVIDHINRNKLHNRRENLRSTTYSMNAFNQKARGNNSGVIGVYNVNGRWESVITVKGKRIYLGCFKTIEEAENARKQAELKYYGELKNKS